MATRSLETKLSITGEKEYKQKLGEVNKDMKVLNSEMKLVTKSFKDNASSVEALTAKQDVLNRALDSQEAKVKLIREQLKKSAEAYGENAKETKDLQISLNNAEAALVDLNRELENNRQALDEANREAGEGNSMWERLRDRFRKTEDDSEGLGDALNGLTGKLGIELPGGVTNAINGLGGLSASSAAVIGVVGGLVAGLAAVEKKLIDITKEAAIVADEVLTTANVFGISAESLQEYSYAAELVDVSTEKITDSLKELTKNIASARDGSAAQAEAFERLGVSYQNTDGSLRDTEDVFHDLIDALGKVSNATERDAIAMSLVGESAQALNPLISLGSGEMKKFAKEAHDVGYVMEKESLTALVDVSNSMQRFELATESAKKQLAAQFAPSLEKVTDRATSGISAFGEAVKRSGVVSAFGMLLETVVDIIAPADKFSEETVPKMTKALRPLSQIVAGIADTMDFISSLLELDFSGALKAAGFGYSYGNGNNMQTLWEEWEQADISAATAAAGYGQYYSDGKWYDYSRYKEIEAEKNKQRKIYDDIVSRNSGAYGGESFEVYWAEYARRNGYNAGGTPNWRGGWTWVGENGPELAYLPRGSAVVSAQESSSVGDTYYITIDAKSVKEFNDIVRVAQSQRRTMRMSEG